MPDKINLAEKLNTFDEHWSPRTIARYNTNDVMVVKVEGEFVWHKHDDTDDFFLVIKGELDIEMRGRTVSLKTGECLSCRAASNIGPLRAAKFICC